MMLASNEGGAPKGMVSTAKGIVREEVGGPERPSLEESPQPCVECLLSSAQYCRLPALTDHGFCGTTGRPGLVQGSQSGVSSPRRLLGIARDGVSLTPARPCFPPSALKRRCSLYLRAAQL